MTDLMPRDPFTALDDPFDGQHHALDRLGSASFRRMPELMSVEGRVALDVREEDGARVIEASVPGFTRDEISVEVTEGAVIIRAERERDEERKDAHYYYGERHPGSVERRVQLPGISADTEVDAALKDGVLTLPIPIAERAKTRRDQRRLIGSR